MATQVLLATKGLILLNFAVQHRHLINTTTNHRISADLCRGGTVAAPAWPTPMQLDINNVLFILMINYGDSSYIFTLLSPNLESSGESRVSHQGGKIW